MYENTVRGGVSTSAEFGYIDGRYRQLHELSEDDLCALLTALGRPDHVVADQVEHTRVEAVP